MQHVRKALSYAQREHGIERLLISDELEAAPGEMFLREYGKLLSLTAAGQFALEKVLEKFLRRLKRDAEGLPIRLYPFVDDDREVVAIDPRIGYGRPTIVAKGISTAILLERVNAGETFDELANYYDIDRADVEAAPVFRTGRRGRDGGTGRRPSPRRRCR